MKVDFTHTHVLCQMPVHLCVGGLVGVVPLCTWSYPKRAIVLDLFPDLAWDGAVTWLFGAFSLDLTVLHVWQRVIGQVKIYLEEAWNLGIHIGTRLASRECSDGGAQWLSMSLPAHCKASNYATLSRRILEPCGWPKFQSIDILFYARKDMRRSIPTRCLRPSGFWLSRQLYTAIFSDKSKIY